MCHFCSFHEYLRIVSSFVFEYISSYFIVYNSQFLPESSGSNHDFNTVNNILIKLGLKSITYTVLSAILNLGNVQFEDNKDKKAEISSHTELFLNNASKLLNVSTLELKSSLLERIICVSNTNIRYIKDYFSI